MTDSIDRILDGIDVGLQNAAGYAPNIDDLCVRACGAKRVDGEFCAPCRAYMLGDLDEDPRGMKLNSLELAAAVRESRDAIQVKVSIDPGRIRGTSVQAVWYDEVGPHADAPPRRRRRWWARG